MSVPKQRKTKSAIRQRRSHLSLKSQNLGTCEQCGSAVKSHRACTSCGMYKGRQVLDTAGDIPAPTTENTKQTSK